MFAAAMQNMRQVFSAAALLLLIILTACGPAASVSFATRPLEQTVQTLQDQPEEEQPPPRAEDLIFEQLTTEDGLSESVVNAILQDHLGFLWFGTQDGLNKFDGYKFTVYKHDPSAGDSLSQSYITSLYEDHRGDLWIGTDTGGLNRFNRNQQSFTRYRHDRQDSGSLSSNRVSVILQDKDGVLWVGTEDAGLNRLDAQTGTFLHFRHQPENPHSLSNDSINDIYQDGSGTLWVATSRGLNRYNPQDGSFSRFLNDTNTERLNAVQAVYEDRQGVFWVGTSGGLLTLDRADGGLRIYQNDAASQNSLSSNRISAILEDDSGVLWVGTVGGGIARYDRQQDNFINYRHNALDPQSLSNNWVLSMFEDSSGIIWVGTYGGGVDKLEQTYKRFDHYLTNTLDPNSLNSGLIYAITSSDNNSLWVGQLEGGLNRLQLETGQNSRFVHNPLDPDSLSSSTIQALHVDRSGELWIGTQAGLNSLRPGSLNFSRYSNGRNDFGDPIYSEITAIAEDQEGNLWIGTRREGLLKFDRQARRFTEFYFHILDDPHSLSVNDIWTILVDSRDRVWVGTSFGLNRLNRAAGQFVRYLNEPARADSLSDNYVMSIFEDSNGDLWVGTTSGLNRLDESSATFRRYYQKDGLPNEYIYAIQEDDLGFLWMSTNNGLVRYDLRTEQFKNYDMQDGLLGNEFNLGAVHKNNDGQMFFGGLNGLTAFYPQNIRENPYVPPVVLTSLTLRGEEAIKGAETEIIDSLTLSWPYNYFEFEFSALSYSRPQRNQYAYMLVGFDETWNYTGSRHSGQYTNLPGDTYTLRIIGANNDGVWNPAGTSIQIRIIPPLWQTWWFRGLLLAAAVAVLVGGYRLRVHSIAGRNRELERQVLERTREIEQLFLQTKELAVIEERNRLARDLHDSAKQKAFAAMAQLGAAQGVLRKNPPSARTHLEEAENLVYEVIQELTFLIQEMYPVALKDRGLISALREYLYEWENRADIPVQMQVEGGQRLPLYIEQAIYRLVQEALANVARHSAAGRVELQLVFREGWFELTIRDDGCGFDPETARQGIGLRSMQERVAAMEGTLEIYSSPGRGTRIRVQVPIQVNEPELRPHLKIGGLHGRTDLYTTGR